MKNFNHPRKACLLMFSLAMSATCLAQRYSGPLSPEEALQKFKIQDGFKIEVYAAEPQVFDPVALEFDEQGNAFVVEMPDYPYEVEAGKGKGRIRILQDVNGDGRIDRATVFAENITEATSILPWKGGLIVTAAPHILYLKDTNNDGQADQKEILFSGFFDNNSEAQITSLRYGIDNWIYANNRGQHGNVTFSRQPGAAPLAVQGADFRFRLDKNKFELETGTGQLGQTINDWGHRFFTENSVHLQQSVIPWRYTHRHPYLPATKAVVSISDHQEIMHQETPPPYWRSERTKQRNKMYQEANMNRIEYAEDRFTGASGGTVYAADVFPKEFYGNIFTSDVAGNLVHRDVLTPHDKNPFYVAKRAKNEIDREFLVSTDPWFRPANFTVGPDGYLYVLDYYRQHIETPVSIPDELKADMDFMAGSDRGRIYRILPTNATAKKVTVNLKNTTSAKLVEVLANPNLWWRLQAQRLLVERQDKSVVPVVKNMVAKSPDARARLHALYVLEGLNALDAKVVKTGLQDASPGVRENAIILAERFPELFSQVAEKINDPVPRVAFQASLSLGEYKNKATAPTLAKVIEKYGQDPWFRTAVLSAEAGSSLELVKALSQQPAFFHKVEPWKSSFLEDFSTVIGARNQKEQVGAFLDLLAQPILAKEEAWRKAAVAGLAKGLIKPAAANPPLAAALKNVKTTSAAEVNAAIQDLKRLY